MFPAIKHLSVGQRIVLGFAVMVGICLVITFFSYTTGNKFERGFDDYKRAAQETQTISEFEADVVELQRQILVFRLSENIGAAPGIQALLNKLQSDITLLLAQINDTDELEAQVFQAMQFSVGNLAEKAGELTAQRQLWRDIDQQQQQLFATADQAISTAHEGLRQRDDNRAASLLLQARFALSSAHTAAAYYFNRREYSTREVVLERLREASSAIAAIAATSSNNPAHIAPLSALIEQIEVTFFQAIQADRNFVFLVNVVIAGEAAELRSLANQVRTISASRQAELVSNTNKRLAAAQATSLFGSVALVLLALIISTLMVRGLVKPIQVITRTFSRLSDGENLQTVPETQRQDEIGQLARAAEVFRQKNSETKHLLHQTEELAASLKVREQDLEKSNRELDNFAYVASHDLKSPLRAIYNLADWIEEDCAALLPPASLDHFKLIRSRIARMENLLTDLLQYSRVGRVETEVEIKNSRAIVEDALELVDRPLSFEFQLLGNFPTIQTQVSPLQQVLQNLLSNAVKYNDKEKGMVQVQASLREKGLIEFSVRDNGEGIAPKFHQRIFQMFQTLHTRDAKESSGMGLAIVKKVLENEGGDIRVESDVGEGATFIFTWPAQVVRNDNRQERYA